MVDDIAITEGYEWADGTRIFDTNTKKVCLLLQTSKSDIHVNLLKWKRFTTWDLTPARKWRDTWLPFRSDKLNCLLWQIWYRILATSAWRFQRLLVGHPQRECKRCLAGVEDINHFLWQCPKTCDTWKWIKGLLQRNSLDTSQQYHVMGHASSDWRTNHCAS